MKAPDTALLWLRIIVSLLCATINGIDLSFNVYAIPLKKAFNFTHTQLEVSASMGCVGFGLSFLEILLTATFGYRTTFILSWITMPLSCGLFAFAAAHTQFFLSCPVFVYLIQLFLSTSSSVALIAVQRLGVEMLPKAHAGKYIGSYGACICFGKIIFSGLFDIFFQDNLPGFFIYLAINSAMVLGTCFLLFYPVAMALENTAQEETNKASDNTPLKDMLRSRFFHMLFWPSAVFASAGYSILNNITGIADSIGVQNCFRVISIFSVCIILTRVVFGLVYDNLSSGVSAFWILLATYFIFGIGVMLAYFIMNVTTLYILSVLTGISLGPAFGAPIRMLAVHFGRSNFSFISVAFGGILAASQMILQVLIGYLYEDEIKQMGDVGKSCNGDVCFHIPFIVMFVIALVTFVSQTANLCLLARDKAGRYTHPCECVRVNDEATMWTG